MSIDWVAVFTTDPDTFAARLKDHKPWPGLLGQAAALPTQPTDAILAVIKTWLKTPKLCPTCRQLSETLR
ncbi:MAG: hypothetical protein HC926_01425 [Synechococcaceae cyanobacterium SM2_3_60]|nr:hypothetical protein [Synechococcaceae cyanobacterium SM2_3_60]